MFRTANVRLYSPRPPHPPLSLKTTHKLLPLCHTSTPRSDFSCRRSFSLASFFSFHLGATRPLRGGNWNLVQLIFTTLAPVPQCCAVPRDAQNLNVRRLSSFVRRRVRFDGYCATFLSESACVCECVLSRFPKLTLKTMPRLQSLTGACADAAPVDAEQLAAVVRVARRRST